MIRVGTLRQVKRDTINSIGSRFNKAKQRTHTGCNRGLGEAWEHSRAQHTSDARHTHACATLASVRKRSNYAHVNADMNTTTHKHVACACVCVLCVPAATARTQAQARKNTRHTNGRHLEGSEIVYVRFQNLSCTHIQVTSTSAHTNIQYANKYAHTNTLARPHPRNPAHAHTHSALREISLGSGSQSNDGARSNLGALSLGKKFTPVYHLLQHLHGHRHVMVVFSSGHDSRLFCDLKCSSTSEVRM